MTTPQNQHNTASNGGQIYATQGGQQIINNNIKPVVNRRGRAIALLVAIVVDVCYYFYGMAAYTGRSGDSGDLYRAIGFFVLLAVTGTLLRRLVRHH